MNYKSLIKIIVFTFICLSIMNVSTCKGEKKNAVRIDSSKYINPEIFMYSDHKRVTMSGNLPLLETDLNNNAWIVGGVYTGIFVGQHLWQSNTIWSDGGKFKFVDDPDYALGADKYGHAFACYATSYLMTEALLESGVAWDNAQWYGTGLGLMYSTYIEVIDGFGENWGFSKSDMYFNAAGAGFFLAQHYVPFLQNFTPKFMYFPSPWFGEHSRNPSENFNDDYSSHTMWLSVDVHNLLPESMKKYWPSWLELSFGYAVRNLCDTLTEGRVCAPCSWDTEKNGYVGSPRYIVALDYNLVDLLPDGPAFWMWIRQTLNHMKMPSPALEFSKRGTKFYLVYPFHISI